jgi:hypothetical protein
MLRLGLHSNYGVPAEIIDLQRRKRWEGDSECCSLFVLRYPSVTTFTLSSSENVHSGKQLTDYDASQM